MQLDKVKKYVVAMGLGAAMIGTAVAQDKFQLPPKWGGAAAIITRQSSDFTYVTMNKGKEMMQSRVEQAHILINSESGANDFKFVYFPDDFDASVEVAKKDGEEESYDETDGMRTGTQLDVPYFFKQLFPNALEYKRINLGKLGKGDEITLEFSFEEKGATKDMMQGLTCRSFGSHYYTMPSIYPKGGHAITIKMSPTMHINAGYMNLAPELELLSDMGSDTLIYGLEAGQTDPVTGGYFVYPYRAYPTLKFEVLACSSYKPGANKVIVGAPGEPLTEIESEDLKAVLYNKASDWATHAKLAKALQVFMGEVKYKTTAELLANTYKQFQAYVYCTGAVTGYNDDMFMGVFMSILESKEIAYSVIAGTDRHTGTLSDMSLNSELRYGLIVKDKKEDYYVFPFTQFSAWNGTPTDLIGEKVYLFQKGKGLEESVIEGAYLNDVLPAANQLAVRTSIKLGDGFTSMMVNKTVSMNGAYMEQAGPYTVSIPEYHKAILSKGQYPKYGSQRDDDEDFKEKRKLIYEARARRLFDTVEYQKFTINTAGFEPGEEWLKYNEKYNIPSAEAVKFQVKDSMRTYTLALGAFVESPYQMALTTMSREEEVYIDFPLILDYRIVFEAPTGYAVFGFDGFDSDINADFGSFKSKAETKGTNLEVKASLVLKKTSLTSREWQELANMLKALDDKAKVIVTMAGN